MNNNETGYYYHLWIAAAEDQLFFASSLDKAFFISLLQDSLSPKKKLDSCWHVHVRELAQLSLLAYSLTDFGVSLLVHCGNTHELESFGQQLLTSYIAYLQDQKAWEILPFDTIFAHDLLAGTQEALTVSREIHLLHDEWRHDHYSSIGFYLDDRRGDWIQPWRLTQMFNNDTQRYVHFLHDDQRRPTSTIPSLQYLET